MSYFARPEDVKATTLFEFGVIVPGNFYQLKTKDAMIVAWRPVYVDDVLSSEIYDMSSAVPKLKGTVSVLDFCDLLGGLFKTGMLPDRGIFDPACKFYRVDYV